MSQTSQSSGIEHPSSNLEYNPKLVEVSRFLQEAWPRPTWKYTLELLDAHLNLPSQDSPLSLAYRYANEISGFLSYLPRTVSYRGRVMPVVFGKWWCTSKKCPLFGIGGRLHKELLSAAKQRGYAGLFLFTHADTQADRANRLTFQRLQQSVLHVSTFSEMLGMPNMVRRRLNSEGLRPAKSYSSSMSKDCLELLTSMGQRLDIAQVWALEQIDYLFMGRCLTRTWVYERGGRVLGFLNVFLRTLVGDKTSLCGCLEHVAFGDMTEKQIADFVASMMADSYWDSVALICAPATGCFDQRLFQRFGFYESPSKYNVYYVPFDSRFDGTKVSSFYLDVF